MRGDLGILLLCLAGLLSACSDTPPEPAATPPFVDASDSVGAALSSHTVTTGFCDHVDRGGGPGVCMFDYDRDGDVDLYLTDRAPQPNKLYRNDDGIFVDATEQSGAGDIGDSMGCLPFDYDGDGDEDLLVTNFGPDQLYRNDDASFVNVTMEVGLLADGFSTTATAGDIDGDQDLDLFIGRFFDPATCEDECDTASIVECTPYRSLLFLNEGGMFSEVGEERGITAEEHTYVPLFIDFDVDGDMDLYVGNDTTQYFDHLYLNDGNGFFTDDEETGIKHTGSATMGVSVADVDGNGVHDMVITDFTNIPTRVFECDAGYVCKQTAVHGVSADYVNWTVGLHDFDGDGDLDLFQVSGDVFGGAGLDNARAPSQLFFNDGAGELEPHTPAAGSPLEALAVSRGAAFGDIDGDGGVDVVIANVAERPQVLINDGHQGHYLGVSLDSLSLGASVTVNGITRQRVAGDSYMGANDPRLFFSVGDATTAEVTVTWLDGTTTSLSDVAVDQVIVVDRPN